MPKSTTIIDITKSSSTSVKPRRGPRFGVITSFIRTILQQTGEIARRRNDISRPASGATTSSPGKARSNLALLGKPAVAPQSRQQGHASYDLVSSSSSLDQLPMSSSVPSSPSGPTDQM